ncbi:hypothetical protein [Phenylobacterium sp.]|uniref:hypothetical protein n=1 Tax=Phenylobacterium sp. TaxID=1871053 RepID=UPI0012137612|nr:hypothetical protein [Phenylobacterium sp.]THD55104.1 MAG: hypothetical protein E8A12_16350 [Phenylobacterium sp.]
MRPGETVEPDYRYLAQDVRVPGHVLLGATPLLPKRQLPFLPSFVDEDDRATLRAQPLLTLTEGPGAEHNVAAQSLPAFRSVLGPVCGSIIPDSVLR